jgi:hypothetical protein
MSLDKLQKYGFIFTYKQTSADIPVIGLKTNKNDTHST